MANQYLVKHVNETRIMVTYLKNDITNTRLLRIKLYKEQILFLSTINSE